jgi:hypothetical protein
MSDFGVGNITMSARQAISLSDVMATFQVIDLPRFKTIGPIEGQQCQLYDREL